jgi:hypothetical protein
MIDFPKPTEPGLPEGDCCGNCRWFVGNKDKHNTEGQCRFNSPVVFPNPVRKSQLTQEVVMSQIQFFPFVPADLCCGQFQKKEGE